MKKAAIFIALVSMYTVHSSDFFKSKFIINTQKITDTEKMAIVPLYQDYCAEQLKKSISKNLRSGLVALAISGACGYKGASWLWQAGAAAINSANTINNATNAIVSIPFSFALNPASWGGYGLLCCSAITFGYACYKLLPIGVRFVKSRSFYAQSLYGLNAVIKNKMSNPKITYHDQQTWDIQWQSSSRNGYNILEAETMKKILKGTFKAVQEIKVPYRHSDL